MKWTIWMRKKRRMLLVLKCIHLLVLLKDGNQIPSLPEFLRRPYHMLRPFNRFLRIGIWNSSLLGTLFRWSQLYLNLFTDGRVYRRRSTDTITFSLACTQS